MKEPLFYPEFDPGLNTHPTLWPRYTGLSTGGCLSRLESLWPECNKLAGLCSCMFVELLCLPMERESGRPARCVWLQGPSWPPMGWVYHSCGSRWPTGARGKENEENDIGWMRTSWKNAEWNMCYRDGNVYPRRSTHKNSSDGSEYIATTEQAFIFPFLPKNFFPPSFLDWCVPATFSVVALSAGYLGFLASYVQ